MAIDRSASRIVLGTTLVCALGVVGIFWLNLTGTAAVADQPEESTLQLHWSFTGEERLKVDDASGHGHHGTFMRAGRSQPTPEALADQGLPSGAGGAVRLQPGSQLVSTPLALGERWTLSFWIREPGASRGDRMARLELGDLVALTSGTQRLAGPWMFRKDPEDHGLDRGWHTGEPDDQWQHIEVPAFLSQTTVGRYHGHGWYRTGFFIPEEDADTPHELHFNAVDEQAWVYVNGEYVGEHTTASEGLETGDLWNRPFTLTIDPEHLEAGRVNQLAVRFHASGGEAGIIGPVRLTRVDESESDLFETLTPMRGNRHTPGAWGHVALVVEPEEVSYYLDGHRVVHERSPGWRFDALRSQLSIQPPTEGGEEVLIDDVRLYAAALDPDAVLNLADEGFYPDAAWADALDEEMRMLIRAAHGAPGETREFVEHFTRLGAPDVDALIKTLKTHDDPDARADAAWALSIYRSDRAIEPLTAMLDGEQPVLVHAAVDALLTLHDTDVFPDALSRNGEGTVELLGRILRNPANPELREIAAEALANIGDEAAVRNLRSAMVGHAPQIRWAARRALLAAGLNASRTGEPEVLKNPYANVDWEAVNTYKANFHSHTVRSDGRAEPDRLIHAYADAGYDILAVTDHDNYHTHREGEREVEPTAETTWPWTRWIDEEPSQIWHTNGMESSAFYPELGDDGMFAVRGNELTTHPHVSSQFNSCGWLHRDQTDDERFTCVQEQGGLAYWAHPSDYVPGGRWKDNVVDASWDAAVRYLGHYIISYDVHLGIEMQLGHRLERDIELFERLLDRYYREHNVFIKGSDDNHGRSVSSSASLTLLLAEDLNESAIRHAMQNGHNFVTTRADEYPTFSDIAVDEQANTIELVVDHYDEITWYKEGEAHATGPVLDYTAMEDAIVRFEVEFEDNTLYSQAFYIW